MFPPMHNSIVHFIGYSKVSNILDHVELGTRFPAVLLPTFRTCRGPEQKARNGLQGPDEKDRIGGPDEKDRIGDEEGRPGAFLGNE